MPFAETRSRSSFPESRVAFPRYNQARFKRRATAVPNSIDRIKFDFSTAVARRLKPSRVAPQGLPCYTAVAQLGFKRRATAVPNSIHEL